MKSYKSLFSSSVVVFIGLVVRIILVMLFELLCARYLGPEKYGTYTLLFTIIVIISTIPTLGLIQSTRRFIALYYDHNEHRYVKGIVRLCNYWTIFSGVLLTCIVYLLITFIDTSAYSNEELIALLPLMLLIIPFYAHRRLAISVFSGFKNTVYKVILEDLAEPVIKILAISIVMMIGGSLTDLTYVTIIGYMLLGVISLTLVARSLKKVVQASVDISMPWKVFIGFSGAMVVTELVELILTWLDIIMLGMLSSDYQVGLFRAATQPAMLASVILTSFAFIYMPLATELYGRKEPVEWKNLNNLISLWSMTLAFPVSVVCIAYPDVIIGVLFGEQYADAEVTLRILALAYIFHSACGFTGLNLIIGDKSTTQMKGKLISLCIHVILNIILIPDYGAKGAAISVLLSLIFSNAYNLYWTNKYFSIHPFEKRYFSLLMLNIGISIFLYLLLGIFDIPGYQKVILMALLHLPLLVFISLKVGVVKKENFLIILEWIQQARKSK